MKQQRGVIAQLYLYAAGALALVAVIGGMAFAWQRLEARIDKAGYERGVAVTDAAYKTRDNAQLQAVITAQAAAEGKAKAAEEKAVLAQADSLNAYTKGVNDGRSKVAGLIAAGSRLFDSTGTAAGTCPPASPGIASPTLIAAAPRPDAFAGCELSLTTSAALLQLANEADTTALRLTAAQARIVSDYEMCK